MFAIETVGLERRFGQHAAVDGISLQAPTRAVYAFLGPNGAGKTTTIRLILGLLRPTRGAITVLGLSQPRQRKRIAARLGALVETPALYEHLTGRENLDLTRRIIGAPPSDNGRVLDIVDLTSSADRRVGGYSLGMRQRLGLARAMLGRPELLVLDEPTNGLDTDGILDMRKLIRELPERGKLTVFVSSHMLSEVEHIATHVALMHEGRLLVQGLLRGLVDQAATTLEIGVRQADTAAAAVIALGLAPRVLSEDRVVVSAGPVAKIDAAEVNRTLVQAGLDVFDLRLRKPSLEDLYVRLTAKIDRTRAA